MEDRLSFVEQADAEACFIEIATVEALYKLPKKFKIPTYFFVSTKDREILENISGFAISGLFFPPFRRADMLNKLDLSQKHDSGLKTEDNFDIMRAKIIAKAENIPALPNLAKELIRLTRSDNAQLKDFVIKIKKDQGLSSKIIKLVNSPFYGLRKDVNSIDRATVLLGVNTVKNLALAVSTELYYNKDFGLYNIDGKELWRHSFSVALLCEAFAKRAGEDTDALYLAGLMHDIGKTILVDFLVKEVDGVADEKKQLGMEHSQVGAMVLEKWAVLSDIVNAVKEHHAAPTSKFSKILYYANKIDSDEENRGDYIQTLSMEISVPQEQLQADVELILTTPEEEEDE